MTQWAMLQPVTKARGLMTVAYTVALDNPH